MNEEHILVHYKQALQYYDLVVVRMNRQKEYDPIMKRMREIASLPSTKFVEGNPSLIPRGLNLETNYLVCGSARGSCPKLQMDSLRAAGFHAELLEEATIQPIPADEFMRFLDG